MNLPLLTFTHITHNSLRFSFSCTFLLLEVLRRRRLSAVSKVIPPCNLSELKIFGFLDTNCMSSYLVTDQNPRPPFLSGHQATGSSLLNSVNISWTASWSWKVAASDNETLSFSFKLPLLTNLFCKITILL